MLATLFCLTTLCVAATRSADFNLLLLHNNDMHARFEETEPNSSTCKPKHAGVSCVGGFARTAHVIRKHRKEAKDGTGPPVLYINGGDTFTGTAWFGVFTDKISSEFVNLLEPDVVTLGNHEFDKNVEVLARFLDNLNSPVVATNLNFSDVPSLQNKTKTSVVLNVSGKKIGVVGYLTPTTPEKSHTNDTIFYDEIEALKKETEKLKEDNVTIIIAVGHSGHSVDKQIAKEVELIDIIVGGHSHSLLWNGPSPSTEEITDAYPTIVTQSSGKQVPIVQVYAFTKYFGILNVTFDDNGDLVDFVGSPMLLDASIPQDQDVLDALEKYRPQVYELYNEVIGTTSVILEGDQKVCYYGECNFGDLLADALVTYLAVNSTQIWTDTPIGLFHSGSIRDSIDPFEHGNNISTGQLMTCLPFENDVVTLSLKGKDLTDVLEHAISNGGGVEFLQVSGLRVTYDKSQPKGSRVVSLRARCGNCSIPIYEPVEVTKDYRVVTTTFVANGGDGHTVLRNKKFDVCVQSFNDLNVASWFLQQYSPVYPAVEGRIKFSESKGGSGSSITRASAGVLLLVATIWHAVVFVAFM